LIDFIQGVKKHDFLFLCLSQFNLSIQQLYNRDSLIGALFLYKTKQALYSSAIILFVALRQLIKEQYFNLSIALLSFS
jgi:hypothetical protein